MKPKDCVRISFLFANRATRGSGSKQKTTTAGHPASLLRTAFVVLLSLPLTQAHKGRGGRKGGEPTFSDITLWIPERQVAEFSTFVVPIYIIREGKVMPYLLDPKLEANLPVVPADVSVVNFTWQAGNAAQYHYDFDILESVDSSILMHPQLTIPKVGRVPKKAKDFQVHVNCTGTKSGIVRVRIRLNVKSNTQESLPGTPLRLYLRKECLNLSASVSCGGGGGAQCYQRTALCFPKCLNNGTCVAPGVCSCPDGYQGPHCEGGLCSIPCRNGGKCVQKDQCSCRKGYYGPHCEYSKCIIPCINGRCIGVNRCRCKKGYEGMQCDRMKPKQGGRERQNPRRHSRSNAAASTTATPSDTVGTNSKKRRKHKRRRRLGRKRTTVIPFV